MADGYRNWPAEERGGADEVFAPVRERVRAHPWMGMAAGIAAGALLGVISRRGADHPGTVRIRVDRNAQLRLRLQPAERPEPEEEGPGLAERAGERLRATARGAGESLRHAWEEVGEAVEDAARSVRDAEPLERLGGAVRSGVDQIAERLPRRRPRSRVERLRRAVSDALPHRQRTLGERVRRAFD